MCKCFGSELPLVSDLEQKSAPNLWLYVVMSVRPLATWAPRDLDCKAGLPRESHMSTSPILHRICEKKGVYGQLQVCLSVCLSEEKKKEYERKAKELGASCNASWPKELRASWYIEKPLSNSRARQEAGTEQAQKKRDDDVNMNVVDDADADDDDDDDDDADADAHADHDDDDDCLDGDADGDDDGGSQDGDDDGDDDNDNDGADGVDDNDDDEADAGDSDDDSNDGAKAAVEGALEKELRASCSS